MLSKPLNARHVLVVVGTVLTEFLDQAKAKFLFGREGAIDYFVGFLSPEEKVWKWSMIQTTIEGRRRRGQRSHVVKYHSELVLDHPPFTGLKAWPKIFKGLPSDVLHHHVSIPVCFIQSIHHWNRCVEVLTDEDHVESFKDTATDLGAIFDDKLVFNMNDCGRSLHNDILCVLNIRNGW